MQVRKYTPQDLDLLPHRSGYNTEINRPGDITANMVADLSPVRVTVNGLEIALRGIVEISLSRNSVTFVFMSGERRGEKQEYAFERVEFFPGEQASPETIQAGADAGFWQEDGKSW